MAAMESADPGRPGSAQIAPVEPNVLEGSLPVVALGRALTAFLPKGVGQEVSFAASHVHGHVDWSQGGKKQSWWRIAGRLYEFQIGSRWWSNVNNFPDGVIPAGIGAGPAKKAAAEAGGTRGGTEGDRLLAATAPPPPRVDDTPDDQPERQVRQRTGLVGSTMSPSSTLNQPSTRNPQSPPSTPNPQPPILNDMKSLATNRNMNVGGSVARRSQKQKKERKGAGREEGGEDECEDEPLQHEILRIHEHKQYLGIMTAQRTCSICRERTKYFCAGCTDQSTRTGGVFLCGSGRQCVPIHIQRRILHDYF